MPWTVPTRRTRRLEKRGIGFTVTAETEIMTHHDARHAEIPGEQLEEFLTRHVS